MKHNQLIEYLERQIERGGLMTEIETGVAEQLLEILGPPRSGDPRFLAFSKSEILDQLDGAEEVTLFEGYTDIEATDHVLCILDTWTNQYVWTDNDLFTLEEIQQYAQPDQDLAWALYELFIQENP